MSRETSLEKLFSAYNQKLTKERAKAFKSWADRFDEEVVEHAVEFVIGEDPRMPAVSRMYNLSRERMMEVAKDTPEIECWFCDATGFIPGIYKDSRGMWTHGIISACKCTNGKRNASKSIPLRDFEHDWRYIDLMKVGKKNSETPWGAVPYFYAALRSAGIIPLSVDNTIPTDKTILHEKISDIVGGQ